MAAMTGFKLYEPLIKQEEKKKILPSITANYIQKTNILSSISMEFSMESLFTVCYKFQLILVTQMNCFAIFFCGKQKAEINKSISNAIQYH